jgi:5-methylcytosine-specific restriction endonuclease McrA
MSSHKVSLNKIYLEKWLEKGYKIPICINNGCENKDGMLGFVCPMDKSRYDEFPSDIYHMDHFDGNHQNNILSNLKTFCSICHTRKGRECGDFNKLKKSRRVHINIDKV